MLIRQLQVTQRDCGRNQNVGTRIDEDMTMQWDSKLLYKRHNNLYPCPRYPSQVWLTGLTMLWSLFQEERTLFWGPVKLIQGKLVTRCFQINENNMWTITTPPIRCTILEQNTRTRIVCEKRSSKHFLGLVRDPSFPPISCGCKWNRTVRSSIRMCSYRLVSEPVRQIHFVKNKKTTRILKYKTLGFRKRKLLSLLKS